MDICIPKIKQNENDVKVKKLSKCRNKMCSKPSKIFLQFPEVSKF